MPKATMQTNIEHGPYLLDLLTTQNIFSAFIPSYYDYDFAVLNNFSLIFRPPPPPPPSPSPSLGYENSNQFYLRDCSPALEIQPFLFQTGNCLHTTNTCEKVNFRTND